MQFKSLFTLGLASVAVAAPAMTAAQKAQSAQDLATVQAVFNDVQAGIDVMVQAVKTYTGEPAALASIQSGSDNLMKIINDGAKKVAASTAMGLADAIGVLGPVSTLGSKVDEIVLALAEKKETFTKLSLQQVVIDDLKAQKGAADELVKAILANLPMPGLLGIIAGPIAKGITDKIDNGIKQWGGA